MTIEVEQPSIDQLRQLHDAARGFGLGGIGHTWVERVQALNEAFGMRRTWPTPADKELRIAILRYLHSAGL